MGQQILERMEILHLEKNRKDVAPNTICYNAVINAWAKSNDKKSGRGAERILEQMEKEFAEGNTNIQPDVISYYGVIDALIQSSNRDSAENANKVLERMEKNSATVTKLQSLTSFRIMLLLKRFQRAVIRDQ